MFQRLNKMFVGEVNTSSNQEPEFSEKEDDEWILVDFIDTCTGFSAAEDEEEDDISEESPPEHPSVFSCLPASLECLADTSDSCFLQFESCPMEESWFITPPPCFTAGGLTTIKVETSPMENLLIEHPSMSVYAVHDPCPSLGEAHCGTEEFHNPGSPRVEAENEMGQHIHCYVAALAAHTAFLEQPKSFRPSQWIKEHGERQSLNRNSLRRQNLTRDCHSRQVKHSGWAVHQPCPVSTITKNLKRVWLASRSCAYVWAGACVDGEAAVSLQPTDDQSHSLIGVFRHCLENQIHMLCIT